MESILVTENIVFILTMLFEKSLSEFCSYGADKNRTFNLNTRELNSGHGKQAFPFWGKGSLKCAGGTHYYYLGFC